MMMNALLVEKVKLQDTNLPNALHLKNCGKFKYLSKRIKYNVT